MITNYTRVNLKVEVKDYPHGKLCKLHFWLDGYVDKVKIDEYIKNGVEFDIMGINPSDIVNCYIDKIAYTNDKSKKEDFGNIILDSCTTVIEVTPIKNNKDNDKDKNKHKKLVLYEIPTDDLKVLKNNITIELFKRKYFLSDDEYEFFIINKDIIPINDVKEMYLKYNGDVFKLKKINIRNILTKTL